MINIISLYDELNIEAHFRLSEDDYLALVKLYQPIISPMSLSIFITMYYISFRNKKLLHKEICDLAGITILQFLKTREMLESVGLVETYKDDTNYYVILRKPMTVDRFLNGSILGGMLKNKIGDEMFDKIVDEFNYSSINLDNLVDISKRFNDVFYEDINVNVTKSIKSNIKINFNYEKFLKKIQGIVPQEFINDTLEIAVLKCAKNYLLSEQDMKKAVLSCMSDDYSYFDIELLDEESKKIQNKKSNKKIDIKALEEYKSDINLTEIENLIKKHFKFSTTENVLTIKELIDKTGLNLEAIDLLLEEVKNNTQGVFPNSKYFTKIGLSYVQRGIRGKKDLEKHKANFDDFFKNIEEEFENGKSY